MFDIFVLESIEVKLQVLGVSGMVMMEPDRYDSHKLITSCRNVISIEHMAIALCLLFLWLKTSNCNAFTIFQHQKIILFNILASYFLNMFLKISQIGVLIFLYNILY